MATVVGHLSVDELEARYRASLDVTQARHFQTIWLLAKGHTVREVCETMSFGERWIDQVRERYNAFGPDALGDRRCGNGSQPSVLEPQLLGGFVSALTIPRPTVAGGLARRLPAGWRSNWAWRSSRRRAGGRL